MTVHKGPLFDSKATKVQTSIRLDGDVILWLQTTAHEQSIGGKSDVESSSQGSVGAKPAGPIFISRSLAKYRWGGFATPGSDFFVDGSNSLTNGRDYRARTDDIHLVRVALYLFGLKDKMDLRNPLDALRKCQKLQREWVEGLKMAELNQLNDVYH